MVCNKEKLRGADDKCAFENLALKLGVSTDEFLFHSNLGRINQFVSYHYELKTYSSLKSDRNKKDNCLIKIATLIIFINIGMP